MKTIAWITDNASAEVAEGNFAENRGGAAGTSSSGIFEYRMNAMSKRALSVFMILCLFLAGCEGADIGMAIQAGVDAIRAATIDDKDVELLARELSRQSDLRHTVAPPENDYSKRLQKLTENHHRTPNHEFNYKVYLSPQVNAFAMADGTIRVYSGLMDMLDDDELVFVIGHEMGHVAEKHITNKIKLAYAGSAVRKAIASLQNEAGAIARSGLGALAENLLNAQFSQQEEREADDYGVMFLKQEGHDAQPAISALMKLASLGNDHSFLSSHPAPEARANRLRENTLTPQPSAEPSIVKQIVGWLKKYWPFENFRPFAKDKPDNGWFTASKEQGNGFNN
jgi:metalloprotease